MRRVLVANRGEIALRVFRTCEEMGIGTVAVHSDADASAAYVRAADAAVRLPGNAPSETYLRGDLIVKAALAADADAVHPGYGFLSENADFARAVQDAGLVWIGPPPEAIEAMASKTRAKRLMAEAGVPLLAPVAAEEAREDQLPLLVKAAAGGGGRGMRVVRELAALADEIEAARAEAASAFGDGEVFVEPYVERGRHVEVQVLADGHGTVWALGTRDCSLQRRHQKVIEEAPAPGLGDALRASLHEAAVKAARAVGYRGAGTVEFLVAGGASGAFGTGEASGASGAPGARHEDGQERAYFLEMNTRLQVEHPVTECVHGLDLVAHQIRVAEGAALDPEGPPAPRGHAVEARLYAEDPARGWRPQTGTLHRLDMPDGVRLDTGVSGGDEIGVHYDPMLAKVIAWAPGRDEAVRKLARALERARVHGPVTNRELLVRSLRHPDFMAARLDTGFYDRHLDALTRPDEAADHGRRARLAALAAALADAARTRASGTSVAARLGGWRNVPSRPQTKGYRSEPDGTEHEIRYTLTREGLAAEDLPGVQLLDAAPERVVLEVDGVRREFEVSAYGGSGGSGGSGGTDGPMAVYVDSSLGSHALTPLPRFPDPADRTEPGSLLAQLPGTVVRVAEGLAVGSRVAAGEPLLWLEAMKMEHKVVAPASGILTALNAVPGRQVEVGTLLAVVSDEPSGEPPAPSATPTPSATHEETTSPKESA